jgi:hypothetical protein
MVILGTYVYVCAGHSGSLTAPYPPFFNLSTMPDLVLIPRSQIGWLDFSGPMH